MGTNNDLNDRLIIEVNDLDESSSVNNTSRLQDKNNLGNKIVKQDKFKFSKKELAPSSPRVILKSRERSNSTPSQHSSSNKSSKKSSKKLPPEEQKHQEQSD